MKVTFDTAHLEGQNPQYAIGFCRGLLGATAPTRPEEQIGWQVGKRVLEDSRKELEDSGMTPERKELSPALDRAFEQGFNARKANMTKRSNHHTVSQWRAAWNQGWDRADALMKEAEEESPERDPLDRLDEVQHRMTQLELGHKAGSQETMDRLDGLFRRVAELEGKEPAVRVQRQVLSRIEGRVNSLEEGQVHLKEDMNNRADQLWQQLAELEHTQDQDRSEVQHQLESDREAVRILKDEVAVLKTRLAELQERFADSRNMFHAWSVDADARIEELESKVEDLTTSFRSARMMQERQEARLKNLDQKIEATLSALEAHVAKKAAAKPTKCATESSSRSAWQCGILPDKVRAFAEQVAKRICEESGGRKDTESSIVDIVMRELQLETEFILQSPAAGPWRAGFPVKPGPWLVAGPSMGVLRGFVENDTAGTFVRVGKSSIRQRDGEISHYARIYPPGKEPTDE